MRKGGREALTVLFGAFAALLAIGLLDLITPSDADFGEFYMVPVILVAWAIGRSAGIVVAILALTLQYLADVALRADAVAGPAAIMAWNSLSELLLLVAIAVMTDFFYRERQRWRALDIEQQSFLRMLRRELPRPLQGVDWFARTFEDALGPNRLSPAMQTQFARLRHHAREASFLATDLFALAWRRMGRSTFERTPFDLRVVVTEAADDSLVRSRVMLRMSGDHFMVEADADRLRHAVASVIARFMEKTSYEPINVFVRGFEREAAIEISVQSGGIDEQELELARLLVAGNGGRLLFVPRGERGAIVTIYLPSLERPGASAQSTSQAEVARVEPPSHE